MRRQERKKWQGGGGVYRIIFCSVVFPGVFFYQAHTHTAMETHTRLDQTTTTISIVPPLPRCFTSAERPSKNKKYGPLGGAVKRTTTGRCTVQTFQLGLFYALAFLPAFAFVFAFLPPAGSCNILPHGAHLFFLRVICHSKAKARANFKYYSSQPSSAKHH
jgi:hypothetical protein